MIPSSSLNILIVGHYFPPFNTPRAFRAYELGEELARQGHHVTFRVLKGEYDYSEIENENLQVLGLGKSHLGNVDSRGYYSKNWILRGMAKYLVSYEFPSIELMWMITRTIKNISEYDLVISVAYPYPVHWGIGRLIQRLPQNKRPLWISDCGDPYTGNPMAHFFSGFKRVERWWGNLTDYITVPIESARKAYFPEVHDKIRVIPQGFNFRDIRLAEYEKNEVPTFIFSGMIYKDTRDPSSFIEYLLQKSVPFKFIIYTRERAIFKEFGSRIDNKVIIRDYIPREQLLIELSKADFLVNIVNTGTVQAPSKLIDYSLSKRPILNISSEFKEQQEVDQFLKGDYTCQYIPAGIENYDIRNVAAQFLDIYYNHQK